MNRCRRASYAAALAAALLAGSAAAGIPAMAGSVPNCSVSCHGSSGGTVGGGSTGNNSSALSTSFVVWTTGVNDVAVGGPNGSVWAIGPSGTFCTALCVAGTPSFGISGTRLAVGPDGLPWMVASNHTIWKGNSNGSVTQLPGLANDIGVGADGQAWVIGTNSRNGSWQVYHLVNGNWVADPGSGQFVDVSANGFPVVSGSDGKIWIKDGGPDQGWSQLTGLANDMAVKHDPSLVGLPSEPQNGQSMWITGLDHVDPGVSSDLGVWFFDPTTAQWSLTNQNDGGRQIAVDFFGRPWVVDSANELLLGTAPA